MELLKRHKKVAIITAIAVGLPLLSFLLAQLKIYQYNQELYVEHYWNRQKIMFIKVCLWALMSYGIFRLARLFPFEQKKWILSSIMHMAVSLIFAAGHSYLYSIAASLLNIVEFISRESSFRTLFILSYRFNFAIYWMVLGLCVGWEYYKKFRKEEREAAENALLASQLEAQLAASRLNMLKMQIHPHFLFNSLHTVSNLIREKSYDGAIEMISRISEFLRITLDRSSSQFVNLREELDLTDIYTEIESIRFRDRLTVSKNIPESVLDLQFPFLILQPIVENSIKHGLSKRPGPSTIRIDCNLNDERLNVSVTDDGPGLPLEWNLETSNGLGLSNISKRLHNLYGNDYSFLVENGTDGGVIVSITVPATVFRGEDA